MAKPVPKIVRSTTVNKHAAAIWEHLEGWHAASAKHRRANIEGRVKILSNTGRDPDMIYAALATGVRVVKAHYRRLSINAAERGVASDQSRVWRDLDKAVRSLEWWIEMWGDSEEVQFGGGCCNPVERLRELRSDFEQSPLPIFSGERRVRLLKTGRPALRKRPEELLRRARVPKEERAALLDALGV